VDCPLEITGEIDVTGFGLGCVFGTTTAAAVRVSGSWSADELGNLEDNTITQGVHDFELARACTDVGLLCEDLERPLTSLGYDTVECITEPETNACVCRATFYQEGGLAAISFDPFQRGRYSIDGTTLTPLPPGEEADYAYEYCVMDDAMVFTLAAPGKLGLVEGSIVLQRE
jgi:hypothetical protein